MLKKITQQDVINLLDVAYEAAINGIPKLGSAEDLANDYLYKAKSIDEAIDLLIRWQVSKCTTSGFLSGLGGIITMPVTIPANISSVIYIQIRMIAAIAFIKGYDIRSDKVKSLVYMCLCGNAGKDIAKQAGIIIGVKLTENMIKQIPGKTFIEINKKVGFRLLTKFGEKGVVNMGKMIPLAGGVIGGAFDYGSTKMIGNIARKVFL